MGQESRRHERFAGTLTVKVEGDGTQRYGTIYEISQGGAFLEVSPLPIVGILIRIVINEGKVRHALGAEVRYRVSSEIGPRGIEGVGVSWIGLDAEQVQLIQRLLERASSGQPLRGVSAE
jgi:PilZ domain